MEASNEEVKRKEEKSKGEERKRRSTKECLLLRVEFRCGSSVFSAPPNFMARIIAVLYKVDYLRESKINLK